VFCFDATGLILLLDNADNLIWGFAAYFSFATAYCLLFDEY
jgi:hypothetical protein